MSQYIYLEQHGNFRATAVKQTQTCCPGLPLDCPPGFSEMIWWLHEGTIFHPWQLLGLGSCLPTHSFTTMMWVQAPVGWHCSQQGSRVLLSLFYSSSVPLCALHCASVNMRAPWEFTAMASDEINQALQIQVVFCLSFGSSFKSRGSAQFKI